MINRIALISILSAAPSLFGADTPPWTIGLETFFSAPAGSIRNLYTPSHGTGVGLFLAWDLGRGHGLRFDLGSGTTFPSRDKVIQGRVQGCRLSSTSLLANYTYHPKNNGLGPYLLAGMGMKSFLARSNAPLPSPEGGLPDDALLTNTHLVADTGLKFSWVVGGGFQFSRLAGLTLRCVGTQAAGHTLTTLEAGINARF